MVLVLSYVGNGSVVVDNGGSVVVDNGGSVGRAGSVCGVTGGGSGGGFDDGAKRGKCTNPRLLIIGFIRAPSTLIPVQVQLTSSLRSQFHGGGLHRWIFALIGNPA